MSDEATNIEKVTIQPVLPSQVKDCWQLIQAAARTALGDLDDKAWEGLYADLQRNQMLAYFIVGLDDGARKALGLVLLQPAQDRFTGERVLHVVCLYAYRKLTEEHYREMIPYLFKVARALGVKKITAITEQPAIIELTNHLGGRVSSYITMEV